MMHGTGLIGYVMCIPCFCSVHELNVSGPRVRRGRRAMNEKQESI